MQRGEGGKGGTGIHVRFLNNNNETKTVPRLITKVIKSTAKEQHTNKIHNILQLFTIYFKWFWGVF